MVAWRSAEGTLPFQNEMKMWSSNTYRGCTISIVYHRDVLDDNDLVWVHGRGGMRVLSRRRPFHLTVPVHEVARKPVRGAENQGQGRKGHQAHQD